MVGGESTTLGKPPIVLTGPTSGLGMALFDKLTMSNFDVIPIGRRLTRLKGQGVLHKDRIIELNLDRKIEEKSLADIGDAVRKAVRNTDSASVVFVNNAAIIDPIGKALDISLEDLETALMVNFISPLAIARELTRVTASLDRKLFILNLSTGAISRAIKGWLGYCTSKLACVMALDVLSAENYHLDLMHFDPGVIDTEMQNVIRRQSNIDMPDVEAFKALKKNGKLKAPETVASEIIELIMDRAR